MKDKRTYLFRNTVYKKRSESAKTIFSGPGELEISPAPEFNGSSETLNPEEMFVAAINGCLMTTFYYLVNKSNIEVLSYYSEAESRLEKQEGGFRFTNVEVRAEVTLRQENLAKKVLELGDLAEKYCLVSRSVTCDVHYELKIKTEAK